MTTQTTSHRAALLAVLLTATAGLTALPAASALPAPDPHVASLTVGPAYINVGRTTTVTLVLASSYGDGQDNYLVNAVAPDGSLAASAWFNFTSVGPMSMLLGNASQGFMAKVTQVGAYTIEALHANGASLDTARVAALETTDKLLVTTEFATASNPYTDAHVCPVAEEFQRGDEIIARGYVRYLSTGEFLNVTLVPTAKGNVTGTFPFPMEGSGAFAQTKPLVYKADAHFWRAAWMIPWDAPLGTYQFTVQASDGLGNSGTGVSPPAGILGALRIIPATLKTSVLVTNATSGQPLTGFYPGDAVGIAARTGYALHYDHNYNYTMTNATLKAQFYPLGMDRSGIVTAVVGSGAYDAPNMTFANQLAKIPLAYDAATGNWTGSWAVPDGFPATAGLSVKVVATDGAPTPNHGDAAAAFSTLARPEPQTVTVTVETLKGGAVDGVVAYALLVVGLVAGVGAGALVMRSRAGKGGKGGAGGSGKDANAPRKDDW